MSREGTLLVLAGDFEHDVDHTDLGLISRGTRSYEYYWLDRWYNTFRFHEPDGSFRNFYCNISMPPTFDGETLDYVDLDIDVVIWPDRGWTVLDMVEFEANAAVFQYPDDVVGDSHSALKELLEMIDHEQFPFSDLENVSF